MSLIALIVLTSGCAKSLKDFRSVWTASDGHTISLQGTDFNKTTSVAVTFTDGAVCTCNILLTGNEDAGAYGLSQCTYTGGGAEDPVCGYLNVKGTFTKPGGLLFCSAFCTAYN